MIIKFINSIHDLLEEMDELYTEFGPFRIEKRFNKFYLYCEGQYIGSVENVEALKKLIKNLL